MSGSDWSCGAGWSGLVLLTQSDAWPDLPTDELSSFIHVVQFAAATKGPADIQLGPYHAEDQYCIARGLVDLYPWSDDGSGRLLAAVYLDQLANSPALPTRNLRSFVREVVDTLDRLDQGHGLSCPAAWKQDGVLVGA